MVGSERLFYRYAWFSACKASKSNVAAVHSSILASSALVDFACN
ncbi:MAG: hypothetical protein BWY72_01956 [Bacteroidetes bacterium ADurb.Bin416]|nr:MAG: hypothetical protein BWY72_01956 [Bacteroidetes bacterium ADurb.Bin416]